MSQNLEKLVNAIREVWRPSYQEWFYNFEFVSGSELVNSHMSKLFIKTYLQSIFVTI